MQYFTHEIVKHYRISNTDSHAVAARKTKYTVYTAYTSRLKESNSCVSRIREGRELVEEPLGQLGVHRYALVRVVKLVKVARVERVCDLGLKGGLDLLGKQ